MRAKVNGDWFGPFDPSEVNFNYTETNAWQYSLFVPQDVEGLISLYVAEARLRRLHRRGEEGELVREVTRAEGVHTRGGLSHDRLDGQPTPEAPSEVVWPAWAACT